MQGLGDKRGEFIAGLAAANIKLWAVREWFELVKEKHFTKIHRFIAGASSYSEGHSSSNPWYGRSLVGFYHWEANK